jgi:acyl-CoA reductase-like NAD-dependent aldehyde dehydrogenase
MKRRLFDPTTGGERGIVTDADASAIDDAVRKGRRAAAIWASFAPRERADRLLRLADRILDHRDEYVVLECAGTGKPTEQARGEIEQSADLFRFYAQAARSQTGPASGSFVDGYESWVRFEPVGIVGAILPWNYPMLMAAWRCAPALAAGNSVVVKPAESTPDSATLLAEHAAELLGPHVLDVVTGGRETGRLLCESSVDLLAFTGSARAGREVAKAAGTRHVSLELGGNGPVVVFPDAPRDTFERLADATIYNAGQNCAAPARVIAVRCGDQVAQKLREALGRKVAGRDFGPLNNPDQLNRYDSLVTGGAGRRAWFGTVDDQAKAGGGYYRPVAVIEGVRQDDPVVTEEIFAPILTVQEASSTAEAIALANDVPQALAASVWTTSIDAALAVARQLIAGEVWVNCHLVQSAELPHGGRRASGSGVDLSVLALAEYQRPKTVTARVELE